MVILRHHSARRGEEVVAFGLPFRSRLSVLQWPRGKGSRAAEMDQAAAHPCRPPGNDAAIQLAVLSG